MGFGGTPEGEAVDGGDLAEKLLRALPAAAFVIDGVGTILYATARAAGLVGRTPEMVVGESVLSYVDGPTAWAYASSVALATDYPTVITGPLRITLLDLDGNPRHADLWASNKLDDPDIGGIVCLLTEETTAVGLSEAIEAVAGGESLATITEHVIRSLTGHPVVADAAFVVPDGDGFVAFTTTDLPVDLFAATGDVRQSMTSGVRVLHAHLDTLPQATADAAHAAGYGALWIEPVLTADRPSPGAIVLGRRRPGNPSPNQLNSIHQAAALLAVAFKLSSS